MTCARRRTGRSHRRWATAFEERSGVDRRRVEARASEEEEGDDERGGGEEGEGELDRHCGREQTEEARRREQPKPADVEYRCE